MRVVIESYVNIMDAIHKVHRYGNSQNGFRVDKPIGKVIITYKRADKCL